MVRRTSRSDAFVDKPRLLEELRACREAVIREQTRMRVGGPLYYAGETVIAAIDALALMLTGQHFYFSTPIAPSRQPKSPESSDGS
ncbi:hypothetical protein [Methylosinus sp. LW4]|uniref:hypothetical protein n=1 Tax=Methylosinus sp. LW4 TaxID=136993 RepID=UPI0003794DB8|nr:hypothetical protein [Methylosinus sp. LW4]